MLYRKMFREMKSNWGQFLSIFLLAFLAMAMFCTFEGHVIGQHKSRSDFHEDCNLAELWIYGEGFSAENLEKVRALDFVKEAGLRMAVTGSAPDCGGAQVDLYLERENLINKPYYISGEAFDAKDPAGVWLTNAFAELWDIKVGDDFTVEYNGLTFTREVKGLIESAEYEYRQADGDADIYLENIAFVYMSYDAFPIRDYVNHMIEQGKITGEELPESRLDQLQAKGMGLSDITQEVLLQVVADMSDESLAEIMPYTQMLVTTVDGLALEHEKDIRKALEGEYAAMVDEHSIAGIERLNSELSQHQTFSYVFVIIFVGIAVLVIATSMSRMVEKQRTQIGTMNALGMRQYKVIFHYIGYSFFVSLLGAVAGIWIGTAYLSPVMVDMFAKWYIVPGLSAGFDISYLGISLLIVAVCVLASYLSCRKILKIRPAEAFRPAPPKQGRRCLFERLPFWNRLAFHTQYNLRDISRAKLRTAMGVIGTGVGMLLMVYGIACGSLVDQMIELNFDKVQPAAYTMNLSSDASLTELNQVEEHTSGELVMMGQIEVAKTSDSVSEDKKKVTVTVLEGKGLYNLLDTNQKVLTLEKGSVGVSRKLCEDLNLQVGDTFYWHIYSENRWYEAVVGYIYHSAEMQGIAYLREDFEKTGADYNPSILYSNEDLSQYQGQSYAVSVHSRKELEDAYVTGMESLSIMIAIMVIFSSILIVVVLYNSGNLSFHERIREFATLKVLGFQSSRIRNILTLQNLWLSLVGIFLGAPFGRWSFNAMMNSNGDNFDYKLNIPFSCYLISGILVLAVSMLVSFLFSKRIKRLDMVDVLKGME